MTKTYTKKLLLSAFLLLSWAGYAQEYTSFTRTYPSGDNFRYQNNIKGDLTFIANNIVNRDGGTSSTEPEDAYNTTGSSSTYNDWLDMQYIDVDSDASTFSSSSATFNFPDPNCNLIRYAGLYWAATYPPEQPQTIIERQNTISQIKLKLPGAGAYIDIIADEILFDGFTSADSSDHLNSPYACYADITPFITALANPAGDYTVANIRSAVGFPSPPGGIAGGWTMVVVYENPNLSGKLITTFDGFARVRGTNSVFINYSGFKTIPTGPVRANIGAAALEGDNKITGDRMRITAASTGWYTTMSNSANPSNNFFNSNISLNGTITTNRNPSSVNTLGYDTDIFLLNNPANSVIPNNETAATFRFQTLGDQYYPFFNSFNIEIIEPDIVLEKRVEDIAGNDITGLGVNLGQVLDYVLSFQNIGNDDGDNYIIRDVLPLNVTLDDLNIVLPSGVTYTYNPATRTVVFTIPNNLVEESDPVYSIRMRVQVAENCFDFVDACSDLIENLAFSTYQGVLNNNVITNDPSVTDFNSCGFVVPGATNFLLDDLSDCNFRRTVQLCGGDVLLDVGDNFDSYVWVRDDNNNGLLDPTDTVLNDGDPDNDPSTLLVNAIGTYIVDKIVADPCKGFKEILDVELFGSTQTNPIVDWFNDLNGDPDPTNDVQGEIVQCSVDGDLLPKIFLCGSGDSQLVQINITDAQSMVWELLDEGSCTAAPDDCANKNLSCTWNQVGTGSDFTANSAGKYRLIINYQNGCFSRFYFDVFQNTLDLEYNKRDIICTTDGNITITNLGAGYGYQLVDVANSIILIPFGANNGPSFDFGTGENGSYRVDVVQLDGSGDPIPDACIFSTPDIGVLDRDFQVDISTTPANCNVLGEIQIDVLNVEPNYTYILRLADGTLVDDETAQADNTHTFQVNPGDYIVEVSTEDGCFDSQNITVVRIPDPVLSAVTTANIGCSAGTIEMTVTGGLGNPDFNYAIWSKDGTALYATVGDIPGGAYQVEDTFAFGWRDTDGDGTDEYFLGEDGDYVFVVVDANNCFAFSNEVTITDNGAMTVAVTDDSVVSCSGSADAGITIVPTGGVGPYLYSIDGGTTTQTTSTFVGLLAGSYPIQVTDSSGCTVDLTHDIVEPFPLSASAGVSRDATCDPLGAQVRITNVVGGTAPYEYSFDGGGTYGPSSIAVLPPGTYTLIVRDATLCAFPMIVAVEDTPPPPGVTLTPEVNYNCDGSGTITATPSIPTYNYTFELDGVPNSPDPSSNVFPNVPPGTYTVRTNYVSATPPTPSLLLSEDFGSGLTIPSPNTNGYNYEDQTNNPPGDTNSNINDFEYSVTSQIVAPFGTWINPIDHTSGTLVGQGRYLVMNVGTPTPSQIIYSKQINDIIPGQNLEVSLYVMNLLRQGTGGLDPDLTVEIREVGTGTVVQSIRTGAIPKNTGQNDWIPFNASLNPGANTSLEFVIRSEINGNGGNDFALDDIEIFQTPEVCPLFVETPVTVVAGRVFASSGINSTNVSCNGLSDGTITFEVENFDAIAGFEYSVDGGATYINSTISPVTTAAIYGVGSQTILIRKANEITCTASVTTAITQPAALVANASITTALNCTNGGATITAGATDGTPTYEYQLENTSGTPIGAFDFATNGTNTVFTGIVPGDYIVRVRDNNLCEDPIDVALTVAPTNAIVFDLTPTTCYLGANNASIFVNVTDGNGGYTFSINGGPWSTPTPANATTHTFSNLANGNYTINVSDGSGCIGVLQNITINPELTVSATAPNITACAASTDITITANGGDTNYVYAVVLNGTPVVDGDFSTTNPANAIAAGDYDVYVRDNGGALGYCSDVFTITIIQDGPIAITPTPTPVSCFGGSNGSISIVVDSGGFGPFEYSIDNGANYQVSNSFTGLSQGIYPVRVRDANNCESTAVNTAVTEPNQIVAEATITQNYTCLQLGEITIGNITPTSGGSGDYQYSINGSTWTTSTTGGHVFVDLTDGTYSISVRDANAIFCAITLVDIIIAPLPTEPALSTTIVYNCDGTGEVTVLPSDPSYTYSIDAGAFQPANLFSNVAIGTHDITVNYGSGCTVDTTIIVESGNAFEASITAFENLDCNADNSGTITITADNFGAGGFEYSLNGGAFVGPFAAAPQQITGLSAQAYTIVVRDVANPIAGCSVILNQMITEPFVVIASASITDPFTCNNTGATITASASGGTPTFVYQLEDNVGGIITAYQVGTTFINLPVGDYIVRARDINLCTDPIDTAITVIAPVSPVFTTTPTTCYLGANNASILVDVTSLPGNGGFQFSLDGGPFITPTPSTATAHTFANLANGTYTIDVRDAFGCAAVQQSVTIAPQLIANAILTLDLTCLADASITINANGGTGTYTYEWATTAIGPWNTTNFTANVYNTNTAGTYFFRVTDTTIPATCMVVSNSIVVSPAVLPVITSVTPTNLNCNADNSGALDIVIDTNFGLAPYVIEVLNTTTAQNYGTQTTGLSAGNYTITLTDAKGCTDTEISIITEPDTISYAVTSIPITCDSVGMNTNPGSITITGTIGGTPEYTYILTANNGIPTQTYLTTSGARDHTFNILNFGIYQIDIVDANGCSAYSTEIIASPPNDLDIDVSTPTANCATGGTAIITVGAAVGSGNYEFAVLETFTSPYSGTYVAPDALPFGNTDTATFTGLTPGITYTFVVHDLTTNCYYFETADAPIDSPSNMTTSLDTVANVTCTGSANGSVSFTFDNYDAGATAVNYEIFNSQSNITTGDTGSSLVNPPAGPVSVVNFATLPPGEYYILLSEVGGLFAGCTVFGGDFSIRESVNLLDVALSITKNDNCNANAGVITATGQFGTAPYEYQFLTSGSTVPTISTWAGSSTNVFNGEGGTYDVYIKDANNCIQVASILLPTDPSPEISLTIVDECVSEGAYEVLVTLDAAGMPPYAMSLNGSAFQNVIFNGSNQYTFSGLSSGAAQTIAVRDLNGCGETENFTIQPPLQFNATLTTLLDCEVAPANNAEITIDVTAGSGSYEYEITGPINEVRTALPPSPFVWSSASLPGTYRVTIYDTSTALPNCNRFIDVVVPAAITPVLSIDAFTDAVCNGDDNGTITVSAIDNGVGPYTFEIISGDGSSIGSPILPTSNTTTSAIFSNLTGVVTLGISYTIRATATNGCTTDIVQVITQPDAIANVNATVVEFACAVGNNTNNASITIDDAAITGGSGNYVRYEFINTTTTTTVQDGPNPVYIETDLAGGNYTINVYDDNACLGSTTAIILEFVEITNPTITITQDITCNPGADAEITVGVTINPGAGATDLSFAVVGTDNAYNAPNQASNAFTALDIGNYLVTVTNHLTGCIVQTTFEIEDPNTFEIATTITDVVCFGTDGSVSFTISDTVNPYTAGFTWQIYNSQGTAALGDDVIILAANGVSANVGPTVPFAIGVGEYRVEITQDSDPSCVNNALFTIAGPSTAITANTDLTPITCVGNDGVIEIIDVFGGWGDYEYYVGTVAPTVAGDYVATPRFDTLAPGTYQAWVIDQNGCQEEIQNTIVLANPTPIAATLQVNQPNCPNFSGEIEVVGVTGGQGSNYTYQLIKDLTPIGASQNTTVFSGLDAGSYTVAIIDQWGCPFTTLAEILYEPIVPLATVVKTIDCTVDPGGQVTITQTGGSGNFTYTVVFPDTSTPLPSNTTGVFTTLTQVGDYVFTITDQAAGHACPVSITQNLQDRVLPVLSIDTFTDVTCNTADDGTITVSAVDNGVGPYSFEIISGDGSSIGSPILPTSNTTTSAIFSNLTGVVTLGISYTIRATAANGCTTDIVQVITQPDAITSVNATVVEFGCTTGNNSNFATITIDNTAILGGSGTYVRYEFINTDTSTTVQDGANASYTETNFLGGNYTINVYDDKGCLGSTTATILTFTTISDATATTMADVTCTPGNDGQIQVGITITPALATPNLEYTTTGTNVAYAQTNITGLFTGLGAGNYAISVTNLDTGCIVQITHEILDPDIITVVATKLTDEECLNNSVDDGSFSIAITNYTGDYSYQVYDNNDNPVVGVGFSGTGNTTIPLIVSNLPGGVYYVLITETDTPFCEEDSNRITIIAPDAPITATVNQEASVGCSNDQGSILVDPEGGQAPYTIELTNTTTSQTYTENNVNAFIFAGLAAGNYDVTITDVYGCPYTDALVLIRPDDIVTSISATALVCFGDTTASVTATVGPRNVAPAYLYQLNTYDNLAGTNPPQVSAPQAGTVFINLPAGFYSITASDDVGCAEETTIVEIVNPTEVQAQLIRTSPLTCITGVEFELSATGGSGTYEYSEDNILFLPMTGSTQILPQAGVLAAGSYSYYVRDAVNSCEAVLSNEITEDPIDPLVLILDTSAAYINCNGDATAIIYADADGGLGNYQYELYTNSVAPGNRIAGPASQNEFSGLAAGTYWVNVISEDCIAAPEQVIIADPVVLTYTEDVVNVTCNGEDNGSITITLSGGSGGYQYAISPNLNQFDDENVFDELAPGDYTIIAQDQNGCFIELQYEIIEPTVLEITTASFAEICFGNSDGSVSLTITGGTAPYSTSFGDNSNYIQDQVDFMNLAAGSYIVYIRDAQGCEENRIVTVDPGVNLNATVEPIYECSGDVPNNYINITMEDESVLGNILYALDSTDAADMQLNPDFRDISPGTHYIGISHANGCVVTFDFEIATFEPLTLSLEQNNLNEITAIAGGGQQEYTFNFGGVDNGADNTYFIGHTDTYLVTVTDENGCEVSASIFIEFIDIEISNFFTPDGDLLNDTWKPINIEQYPEILIKVFDRYGREVTQVSIDHQGWDGTYKGSELPTGDYWYVIQLNGETDEREFIGHFTLYR